MELPTHILLMYGYLLLFAWVLVEQLGIPLPATPVLLAAGALSVDGPISFPLALVAGVVARLICRQFLVPHRAQAWASRAAPAVQIIVGADDLRPPHPGFVWQAAAANVDVCQVRTRAGTSGAPVAGQNGMGFSQFLLYDGIGCTLWVGVLLAVGRFFGDLLKHNTSLLNWAGRFSGALLILGIAGFFLGRIWRRRIGAQRVLPLRASSPKS